jgi:hypothetical protein
LYWSKANEIENARFEIIITYSSTPIGVVMLMCFIIRQLQLAVIIVLSLQDKERIAL